MMSGVKKQDGGDVEVESSRKFKILGKCEEKKQRFVVRELIGASRLSPLQNASSSLFLQINS